MNHRSRFHTLLSMRSLAALSGPEEAHSDPNSALHCLKRWHARSIVISGAKLGGVRSGVAWPITLLPPDLYSHDSASRERFGSRREDIGRVGALAARPLSHCCESSSFHVKSIVATPILAAFNPKRGTAHDIGFFHGTGA